MAKSLEILADAHRYHSSEGEGRTFESCRVRQCFQELGSDGKALETGIATMKSGKPGPNCKAIG